MKRLLSLLLLIALAFGLYACNAAPSRENNQQAEQKEYYVPFDQVYPMLTAEHGEDYVIEWEDEGVEAHVRFWLDKPDGPIYHSDVWNIRYVEIVSFSGFDLILEEPLTGDSFVRQSIISDKSLWRYLDEKLPDICSLRDFRHFDNLQVLDLEMLSQNEHLIDIFGPEECTNLQFFRLQFATPISLEPLRNMQSLDFVGFNQSSGTLDICALAELPNLTEVQLNCTDVPSLEPLVGLPLKYLGLWCSMDSRQLRNHLDYSPITQMDSLLRLDVNQNAGFTTGDAERILDALPGLETVDISHTTAASDLDQLVERYPEVRILCDGKLGAEEMVVK